MRAVDLLLEAGVSVGLNYVVTRQNFDQLAEVLAYAGERGLTDVEFLRLKPSGRGKLDYFERRLTPAQNREFYPVIRAPFRRIRCPGQDRLLVRPDVLLAPAGQNA